MSGSGRAARRPPPGWVPPSRRDGLRVEFVSEDGRQRKWFDFADLLGREQIRAEIADAFEAATGPLGSRKRLQSAKNLWAAGRHAAQWMESTRPRLRSLAELRGQDARPLATALRARGGAARVSAFRSLARFCPPVPEELTRALALIRWDTQTHARQPYTDAEARRIGTVARAIVRRARTRIRDSWALVADYRDGRFDGAPVDDPDRVAAEVLDHCARFGDYPRVSAGGAATPPATRATSLIDGPGLNAMLHLTPREAWAFAVLLAGLTGYNACMLEELPAPHQRATAPGEPGIVLLELSKPRRGPRSAMTLPLVTVPRAFHPASDDMRPSRVRESSLTSAFGVYTLLVELTEPARAWLGTDRAFAYYATVRDADNGLRFRDGLPQSWRSQRRGWLRPWLTGDAEQDEVLLGISLDRLRKTHLERHRRPVAHTPATLARYLRRMNTVTQEGFQIVREALDEQVEQAMQRRRMTVTTHDAKPGTVTNSGQDTVLGACDDFDNAPVDGRGPCRRTFLDCLDCTNARAFPRHLPMQLAVLDALRARRPEVPVTRWLTEYAGRVAQLEDILREYEPAQREQARAQITDHHRGIAARLFAGDLDPL